MALEQVFKCPRTLGKLRAGVLGELIERFCSWLLMHGFSRQAVRRHLSNVSHFDAYLAGRSASPREVISSEDVAGFFMTYPSKFRACGRGQTHIRRVRYSVSRFVECLTEAERFESLRQREVYQALLDAYTEWMRNYQHAAAGTIEVRRHSLTPFFLWLGPEATAQGLSRLKPEAVERFFLHYAQNRGEQRAVRCNRRCGPFSDSVSIRVISSDRLIGPCPHCAPTSWRRCRAVSPTRKHRRS